MAGGPGPGPEACIPVCLTSSSSTAPGSISWLWAGSGLALGWTLGGQIRETQPLLGWTCKWPVPTLSLWRRAGVGLRDSGQGSTDWQQHTAEPHAPSAHSLEAQASLTAVPSAPAPWTSPDEAPWWANPEGQPVHSLHPALPSPQPCAWACCLSCLTLPRTPVFSVQSQGNFLPCHLSLSPGGWACPAPALPLIYSSQQGPCP